jgi:hypothetical protein
MRLFITLVFAVVAIGASGGVATGGTAGDGAQPSSRSSVAAIADTSTSWAEFSARVPDVSSIAADAG